MAPILTAAFALVRGLPAPLEPRGTMTSRPEPTLAQQLADAQEAVRVRDNFLATAGHELRTPMNAMALQLRVLENLLDKGETDRALVEVRRARRILARFLRRATTLLDVSRLNGAAPALDSGPVDVGALVEEVVDGFRDEARFHDAPVRTRCDDGLVAYWDRHGIEVVLSNLVANAIRYAAGQPILVEAAHDGDGHVRLTVADRGAGIAPDQRSRLFQKFEQVADRPVTSAGFGLGLWIVGRVVEAHQGRVEVLDRDGGGTEFRVTLPRSPDLPAFHSPDAR